MLDLTHVRTFVSVACEGSFTRAASALHYAQSSVTAQVQGLEEELGLPLFDRLPRTLMLTAAGKEFLPHAERLLAMADQARQSVHRQGEPSGPLTLSASESVLTYRLPRLLRSFQAAHPKVQVALHPASISESGPPIQTGVDIAVSINERLSDAQLVTRVLRTERVRAVVAASHPLAKVRRLTAAEIVSEQLLLTAETCGYRGVFERALRDAGARPLRALVFASVEAMKHCALARMGIAVLPEMVVEENLKNGSLVALRWGTDLRVYTQLVRRRDRWMSPAMTAFWDAAMQTLRPPTRTQPAAPSRTPVPR